MNLYHLSQTKNDGWDTYDSAVVAAESEDAARMTYPANYKEAWDGKGPGRFDCWVAAKHVTVRLIGVAVEGTAPGVVCARFNAG